MRSGLTGWEESTLFLYCRSPIAQEMHLYAHPYVIDLRQLTLYLLIYESHPHTQVFCFLRCMHHLNYPPPSQRT